MPISQISNNLQAGTIKQKQIDSTSAFSDAEQASKLICQFLNENKNDVEQFRNTEVNDVVVNGKSYQGKMNGKLFRDKNGDAMIILYATDYPPPWGSTVFRYKNGKFEKGLFLGRSHLAPTYTGVTSPGEFQEIVKEDLQTKSAFEMNAALNIIFTWPMTATEALGHEYYRAALYDQTSIDRGFKENQIDFQQKCETK
jgi:hypothetical protein